MEDTPNNHESNNINERVLDIPQRIKRAQILRAHATRIERARELAKKHLAPEKNLKKRAYGQARQIVRRRVAGQRGAEYESLSASEKMVIDRAIDKKQAAIKKLALRLMPRVRSAEQKRMSSYMKGQALQNHGQPEGHHTSAVNEAFAGKFKKGPEDQLPNPEQAKGEPVKGNDQIIQYNDFDKEANVIDPALAKVLKKKASAKKVDPAVVSEVFLRGLEAWDDSHTLTQEQYAFARVNSFLNKGKAFYGSDADLTEGFKNWTFEMSPGDRTKVIHGDHKGKRGTVVEKHDDGSSYTIRHEDGSTMRHHTSTLAEPMHEDVTTADYKNVKVVTPSGKTVWRKQKVNREILDTDSEIDGKRRGKH